MTRTHEAKQSANRIRSQSLHGQDILTANHSHSTGYEPPVWLWHRAMPGVSIHPHYHAHLFEGMQVDSLGEGTSHREPSCIILEVLSSFYIRLVHMAAPFQTLMCKGNLTSTSTDIPNLGTKALGSNEPYKTMVIKGMSRFEFELSKLCTSSVTSGKVVWPF